MLVVICEDVARTLRNSFYVEPSVLITILRNRDKFLNLTPFDRQSRVINEWNNMKEFN